MSIPAGTYDSLPVYFVTIDGGKISTPTYFVSFDSNRVGLPAYITTFYVETVSSAHYFSTDYSGNNSAPVFLIVAPASIGNAVILTMPITLHCAYGGAVTGGIAPNPVFVGIGGSIAAGKAFFPAIWNNHHGIGGGAVASNLNLDTIIAQAMYRPSGGAIGGVLEGFEPIRVGLVAQDDRFIDRVAITAFFTMTVIPGRFTRTVL